eukprot:m.206384 g.206384  ORF g.206384 m.206384 type:complete len:63 (+) comp39675_c0_seq4:363-551(+)
MVPDPEIKRPLMAAMHVYHAIRSRISAVGPTTGPLPCGPVNIICSQPISAHNDRRSVATLPE